MNGQPKIIGVCLSTIHNEDRFYFIQALNRYAVDNNYRLMVFNSCTDLYEPNNANNIGEAAVFKAIPYHLLDAMILLPYFIFDKDIVDEVSEQCKKHDIPVFSLDKELEGCINLSFTYSDAFGELCRHVINDHGAKNIYMIGGVKGNVFSEERINAFCKVMEESGISPENTKIGYGNFWESPTNMLLDQWFIKEELPVPDAIICSNDIMAITASTYLQKMGCNIPEDCIITGFDGIMQAEYHIPHITTCKQDYDKMGRLIIDLLEKYYQGEKLEKSYEVGFFLRKSQSCGCKPIDTHNVNQAIHDIIDRFKHSQQRQTMMCSLQSTISKMNDITELPHILIDKFLLHTCIFALNYDIFSAPDFGSHRKGDNAYCNKINILYQKCFWTEYGSCTISREQFVPDLSLLTKRPEPIIVCCLHFLDMVLGYNVFQPEINFDEYERMHTFMSAINSALGNFHSRIQIKSINTQLLSAINELKHLSDHEYMTGLLNRRGFYTEYNEMLERSSGNGMEAVLISADLDGLKYINDNFGHVEGDNAIITVGKALVSSSLYNEVCARFGGDEFCAAAVIPAKETENYFSRFKERFYSFLADYNEVSGKDYIVEASIGYYSVPASPDINFDELIKAADDHMYEDKIKRKKDRKK